MNINLTDKRYQQGLTSKGNLGRLKKLLTETTKQRPIVYGAIGGSITQGAAATNKNKCYAALFAQWLNAHCASGCSFINAGIGASDSMFGSFRASRDLLVHTPDIITIEYAVNDVSNSEIEPTYESLIRQCLAQPNNPVVILLFTMRQDGSNKQTEHAKIGKHYNLPMLSYRDAVYPDIAAGKLKWKDISPDEVHPNDTGHKFIADMLQRLTADSINEQSISEQQIPPFLNQRSGNFMNGRVVDAEELKVISNNGWTIGPHKGGYMGFQSATPGAEIVFEFNSRISYIGYQKYAGDFGKAAMILDDKQQIILDGFYQKPPIQAWAGGHTVLEKITEDSEYCTHTLKLKLLDDNHPDSNGHKFDIGYLLLS